MIAPLTNLSLDTALLAMEAQAVIWIRLSQIATGRSTAAETQLMITEKMLAFVEAAATMAPGGSAHTLVSGYRKHVQANVNRLQR